MHGGVPSVSLNLSRHLIRTKRAIRLSLQELGMPPGTFWPSRPKETRIDGFTPLPEMEPPHQNFTQILLGFSARLRYKITKPVQGSTPRQERRQLFSLLTIRCRARAASGPPGTRNVRL